MYSYKNAIIFSVLLPITFIVSVIIHEYGHALAAKIVGAPTLIIYIYPGYELTPNFGEPYEKIWPEGSIAFGLFTPKHDLNISFKEGGVAGLSSIPSLNTQSLKIKPTPITQTQHGVMALAGSVLNLIISFVSVFVIYKYRPKGIWFIIALCGALLFYDILFYTVFPTFLNMRHLVLWGGSVAEPIVALSNLGIDPNVSVTIIISLSAIQVFFLCKLFIGHAKLRNNK